MCCGSCRTAIGSCEVASKKMRQQAVTKWFENNDETNTQIPT